MKNLIKYLPLTILLVVLFSYSPIFGGPGSSDDPVVSLSYLELASRYNEIPLRKGEELPIPSGCSFVLLEGDAELRGVGDYYMLDLTIGKKFKRGKDISESHLYLVIRGSEIKIAAKSDTKILVKGGDAGPLRKAN